MSKQINKPVALAVLVGGLALSSSAFAMTDLASGYLLGSQTEKATEGKCGEGKCGTEKMDTNKDGKISKDEFTAHMGEPGRYAKYDTNNDGYIDADEMKAAHEGKCGEGKCGADKKGTDKKASMEGKCGEGKCGGSM